MANKSPGKVNEKFNMNYGQEDIQFDNQRISKPSHGNVKQEKKIDDQSNATLNNYKYGSENHSAEDSQELPSEEQFDDELLEELEEESEEADEMAQDTQSDNFRFSELLESNGFENLNHSPSDQLVQEKLKTVLNENLSKLQREIENSVRYDNHNKLKDLGAGEQTDINFTIEVSKGIHYTPLMLCSSLGHVDSLNVLLENSSLDIDATEERSGTNAFWIAAYYGRGQCLSMLGQAGIDILNKSKLSHANALHASIQRKHYGIAKMLIRSGYPVNELMIGNISALILCSNDKEAYQVAASLIYAGADVNQISTYGQSSLSEAIISDNRRLVEILVKKKADIFYQHQDVSRDLDPFFQAVNTNKLWAIELFCDHGIKIDNVQISGGVNPLIYAAKQGLHEIAMYLSLRVKDINVEDQQTGFNIFTIYMLKQDLLRMQQLIMRGSDVNYLNRKTGFTHLRHAIEANLHPKIIAFLIKNGANPHIMDYNDQDACDVARSKPLYSQVKAFQSQPCLENKELRINPQIMIDKIDVRRQMLLEMTMKIEKKTKNLISQNSTIIMDFSEQQSNVSGMQKLRISNMKQSKQESSDYKNSKQDSLQLNSINEEIGAQYGIPAKANIPIQPNVILKKEQVKFLKAEKQEDILQKDQNILLQNNNSEKIIINTQSQTTAKVQEPNEKSANTVIPVPIKALNHLEVAIAELQISIPQNQSKELIGKTTESNQNNNQPKTDKHTDQIFKNQNQQQAQESKHKTDLKEPDITIVKDQTLKIDPKSELKNKEQRSIGDIQLDITNQTGSLRRRSHTKLEKEIEQQEASSHLDDNQTEFVEKQLKQIEIEHSKLKDMQTISEQTSISN